MSTHFKRYTINSDTIEDPNKHFRQSGRKQIEVNALEMVDTQIINNARKLT